LQPLDPEVEEFKKQVRKQCEKMIKPNMRAELQRDLDEAERIVFSQITKIELENLLMIQDKLCKKCGECCRRCTPILVSREELENIADYLNTPYKKLRKKLILTPAEGKPGWFNMAAAPCLFLKNNECSIYPVRPQVCRQFPAGYITATVIEDKILEIPTYCSIVLQFYAIRLVGHAIRLKMEREEPELAASIRRSIEEAGPQNLYDLLKALGAGGVGEG
jgi:Fe-S-cluster containining protein